MAFWRKHHIKVLWAIVLALLIGNAGGGLVGYFGHNAIQHALGGRKDKAAVIHSHYHPVSAQAMRLSGGGTAPVDLSYLFGPVLNQGDTNACGSFSLTAILYALRIQRGEVPATYFSPWYHRYETVGNTDNYTTMDQNIAAVYQPVGGMVYHTRQESPGTPTQDEFNHADAKSAYYSVVTMGGSTAFDTIRYELEQGHPVWMLNAVNDGMWYLNPANPYTDNSGAYHGAHFEVAVGVYGNYIKMRNSWGTGYGQGGYFYMSAAGIDNTTEEAAVVTIGPTVVWPAPAKATPTPKPQPTATRRPQPRPTATPKPRPMSTPRPAKAPSRPAHGPYVQTVEQALRQKPDPNSKRLSVAKVGYILIQGPHQNTPHWYYLCMLDKHCGYDLLGHFQVK